jgi:hypothetical protein
MLVISADSLAPERLAVPRKAEDEIERSFVAGDMSTYGRLSIFQKAPPRILSRFSA